MSPLANRARAALAEQPVGPTDEELLRVAATTIEPYESSGIAPGEYEAETECAIEVYGSELIAFARAGAHSRGGDVTTSNTRVQRLIDEFEEAASFYEGYSIRHGIAAVLRHLADTEADMESWYAVPTRTLEDLADALEAPTLLERAMKGDATAAKQFLHEAGFTDKQGQWLPQYQPILEAND